MSTGFYERGQCRTGKTGYSSEGQARRANRYARFRLFAYRCKECQRWHVANGDKRDPK